MIRKLLSAGAAVATCFVGGMGNAVAGNAVLEITGTVLETFVSEDGECCYFNANDYDVVKVRIFFNTGVADSNPSPNVGAFAVDGFQLESWISPYSSYRSWTATDSGIGGATVEEVDYDPAHNFYPSGYWVRYMTVNMPGNPNMRFSLAQELVAPGHVNSLVDWLPTISSPVYAQEALSSIRNPSTGYFENFRLVDLSFAVHADAVAAVPEPETYAMFLAGLGLLGAAARRRKTQA